MKRGLLAAACALAVVAVSPRARGDNPEDIRALVVDADRLARDKKYDEALAAIRKAVKLAPQHDGIRFVASEIARRAGLYDEGLEHARAAIQSNDKVAVYYVQAAACAYGTQDAETVLKMSRKVLDMGAAAGDEAIKGAKVYEALASPRTYTITWHLDPSRGAQADGALLVALPKDGLPYQSVAVKVKGDRGHRVFKGDVNDVLRVVPDGTNPIDVITTVSARPYSYKTKLARAGGPLTRDALGSLGAAEGFDPASPKLRKVAAGLRDKDPVKTVRNVIAWMHKNIEYKVEGSDITKLTFESVDELVDRRRAECRGYAMLFVALCRSAGVPARPVWGVLFRPAEQGGGFASHNFDEVYIAGAGWVPVDPQQPESLGWLPVTHVRMYMNLRKGAQTQEHLPVSNLLYMNGEKLQFDITPGTRSPGENKGR
jgi:tetratricopeptide (TPR) repeat protein